MKIIRETQSFGELSPNDTFRRVLVDPNKMPGAAGGCELPISHLCMVVKDGDYNKAYDLVEHTLLSLKRTSPVLRVRTKLVICQENN